MIKKLALVAATLALASCGNSDGGNAGGAPPSASLVDLLKAGDGKGCVHPDVLATLRSVIEKPPASARARFPLSDADVAKLPPVNLTIDRIALAAVDQATKSITCSGVVTLALDNPSLPTKGGERSITYKVSPDLQDPNGFIVATDEDVAADRFNMAVLAMMMGTRSSPAPETAEAAPAATPAEAEDMFVEGGNARPDDFEQ